MVNRLRLYRYIRTLDSSLLEDALKMATTWATKESGARGALLLCHAHPLAPPVKTGGGATCYM